MAVNIFELFGKIGADDKPATQAIDRVVGHARTANNTLSNGLNSMGSWFTGVGNKLTSSITKPAVGAASALTGITLVKGFNRLVGIDDAKAKLLGLGHSGESVENIMKSALESVKGTSFGMADAATIAASAVAAGIEPGEQLTKYLTLTGDAAAIAGISLSEMGSIINKVQTSNVAYTDNLNQLADRGLPIYQWIAKEAGVATDSVKDLASKGEISSEMFLAAIEKNIGGAAKTIGDNSFSASIANMWSSVGRIGANFLDAGGKGGGFFSTLKPLVGEFTELLGKLEDKATEMGVKFGESFQGVIKLVLDLKAKFDALSPATQQATIKAAGMGTAFAVGIGPALQLFGKFTSALSPVAKAFETLNLGIDLIPSTATKAFGSIGSTVEGFQGKLSSGMSKVSEFGQSIQNIGSAGGDIIGKLLPDSALSKIDALGGRFAGVKESVVTQFQGIGDYIGQQSFEWGAKLGRFDNSGLFGKLDAVKGKLGELSPMFSQLGSGFQQIGGQFGSMASGMIGQLGGLASMALKLVGPGAIIAVIIAGLGLAQSQFGTQLDGFFQMATEKGPKIITGLVTGITSKIPTLMQEGTKLLTNFLEALTANLPAIIQGAAQIITSLVQGLSQNVGKIIPVVLQVLQTFLAEIIKALPMLLEAGLTLLMALIDGIVDNLPALITAIVELIIIFIEKITEALPMLIEAGIKILVALIEGITIAIPLLIEALPAIWEAIKNGLASVDWGALGKQVLAGIGAGLSAIGQMFGKIFEPLTKWASDKGKAISDSFKKSGDAAKNSWSGVKEYFKGVGEGIKQGFDATIVWFEGLPAWFGEKWTAVKQTFSDALGAIKGFIDEHFGWIYPYVQGVFTGLQDYFTGAWTLIKNIFLAPILLIVTFFTQGFDEMRNTASQIMQNILDALSQIWEGIKGVFNNSTGAIISAVVNAFINMKNKTLEKMGEIVETIKTKWDQAIAWMTGLPGRLQSSATTAFESAKTAVTNKMTEVYNTVIAKWNAALAWMTGLPARIAASVSDAWEKAKTAVSEKLTAVYETVSTKWTQSIDFLSSIDLAQVGRDAIQGLLNGITEMAEKVWNKMQDIGNGIREKIEGVLGINSPSRVMRQTGLFTGDGLVLGLEDSKSAVFNTMQDIAEIITGTDLAVGDIAMGAIAQPFGASMEQTLTNDNEEIKGLLANMTDVLHSLLEKDTNSYMDSRLVTDVLKGPMSKGINADSESTARGQGVVPRPAM
ncbi:tape measure protein [Enterococcus sp. 5H]|uniref:tape measure protein n=1 Tax=Enterococcus sp. 5H TaxID=1229490 RepID=UPI0023041FA6|nr:tape measure protein [Enterococcus sp. 5H]MDA9472640.1 Phage tape measure [Enterococcus sp. 5H]